MTTRKYAYLQLFFFGCIGLMGNSLMAQNLKNNPTSNHGNKFEQLGTILPDANTYRTASGAPGHQYWQQKADYKINVTLDENSRYIIGDETITYTNNSPDALTYLWLQLDENEHNPNGENNFFDGSEKYEPITPGQLDNLDVKKKLAGYGVQIESVSLNDQPLHYVINMTMMRVDLPVVLQPKGKFTFRVKWRYKIPERMKIGGRGGFEHFKDNNNCLFTISQWYPRMCVYSDYQGWNHKQFTGRGEFSLVFGDFEVNMTVPADHVIAATGECLNYKEVLTADQFKRWQAAQSAKSPIEIVTLEEAKYKETHKDSANFKIWHYKATNVRDFAWGSSRKFVWDAMPTFVAGKKIMSMSYYPKESYHLYSKYSTKVVDHTIRTYSKYTVPYQYPVAISVEASSGMEYPMICFNYGRTDADGNYSEGTKYGMIGVIIHEVGHNFFPMIINSDERNWSWMDEGLNTFVQFLTEQEFDNNYPSRRGPAHKIVDYMRLPKNRLEPIMTNSENIIEFGPNAYAKPATALNILRETVMGRELFDYAFKEYCRRWAYKHPSPADFFRTMEDASGIDLDWFWRAWFFDIEPVEISLDSVTAYKVVAAQVVPVRTTEKMNKPTPQPSAVKARTGAPVERSEFQHLSKLRNKASGMSFAVDRDTSLRDFYYYYDEKKDTFGTWQKEQLAKKRASGEPMQVNLNENLQPLTLEEAAKYENNFYYELTFSNLGGAVSPIILQWNYADSTSEVQYISAYIWRKNEFKVTKNFTKTKEVKSIVLDPFLETADIDTSNNYWPQQAPTLSRFEIFKNKQASEEPENSPMRRARKK